MVKNKNTIDNNAKNEKSKPITDEGVVEDAPIISSETPEDTKKRLGNELKQLHSKIDIETIKKIDSEKDLSQKKKDKLVKKIYPYWVYIVKDGKPIKNFGVREEEINGIKLLIRTEKINDDLKVVFRELYPEPKFDTHIIDANKKRISQELNALKQIEKELESELFDKGETNEYNYDLSDVKIAILQKEIEIDSIKYGKSFRYFHEWVRDDGIPALVYEFENNGLRLKKEVKEKSLFTEASEVKQIESLESRRDIDESLKKSNKRDWLKLGYQFLWAIVTIIYVYGAYQLLDYNQEQQNKALIDEVKRVEASCSGTYKSIQDSLINANKPFIDSITKNNDINSKIIQSCIERNLIDGKPTIVN